MNIASLTVLSLIGLALGAPASSDDNDKLTVTKSLFAENLVQYTGQHEIVSLLLPINGLNLDEEEEAGKKTSFDSDSNENDLQLIAFFVEADIDSDGKREDRGLYVLKDGNATRLLRNGRDAAASFDMSKLAFFGAADGIYVYNKERNSAEKYGTIDDSIIGIAKEATGDVLYILTEDEDVYKVTDGGTKKEKYPDIHEAKQIVLDYSNNIYFYSNDKQAYVHLSNVDAVKKIEGLPENPNSVKLIKPPFIMDNGVLFLVDNKLYSIYSNGTSQELGIDFESDAVPSAFSVEPFLTQLYAYDKKIYEYNILAILFGDILEQLRAYVTKASNKVGPVSLKGKILMRNQ